MRLVRPLASAVVNEVTKLLPAGASSSAAGCIGATAAAAASALLLLPPAQASPRPRATTNYSLTELIENNTLCERKERPLLRAADDDGPRHRNARGDRRVCGRVRGISGYRSRCGSEYVLCRAAEAGVAVSSSTMRVVVIGETAVLSKSLCIHRRMSEDKNQRTHMLLLPMLDC